MCRIHTAKPGLHTAKALPCVAPGNPLTANAGRQSWLFSWAFFRALGKRVCRVLNWHSANIFGKHKKKLSAPLAGHRCRHQLAARRRSSPPLPAPALLLPPRLLPRPAAPSHVRRAEDGTGATASARRPTVRLRGVPRRRPATPPPEEAVPGWIRRWPRRPGSVGGGRAGPHRFTLEVERRRCR